MTEINEAAVVEWFTLMRNDALMRTAARAAMRWRELASEHELCVSEHAQLQARIAELEGERDAALKRAEAAEEAIVDVHDRETTSEYCCGDPVMHNYAHEIVARKEARHE